MHSIMNKRYFTIIMSRQCQELMFTANATYCISRCKTPHNQILGGLNCQQNNSPLQHFTAQSSQAPLKCLSLIVANTTSTYFYVFILEKDICSFHIHGTTSSRHRIGLPPKDKVTHPSLRNGAFGTCCISFPSIPHHKPNWPYYGYTLVSSFKLDRLFYFSPLRTKSCCNNQ